MNVQTISSRKIRVMIVDDSAVIRAILDKMLKDDDNIVVCGYAGDGVQAVKNISLCKPDIILLDIEMPRMDGFEVLRSVRRDENLKDLPVIMITSRTGEKHKQQAMELGVNQYLGKPFQEAKLLATIEEVIVSATAKLEQD